jgi:asparagine synthase (glutamine-hydrolysing)
VANYALSLEAAALVHRPDGVFIDKAPLRGLYDLYPRELPRTIRDRTKTLFSEGSGLDADPADSVWQRRIDEKISGRDFADGKREYAPFSLQTKEELYYLRLLSQTMDVLRVPHLKGRAWLTAELPAAAAVA